MCHHIPSLTNRRLNPIRDRRARAARIAADRITGLFLTSEQADAHPVGILVIAPSDIPLDQILSEACVKEGRLLLAMLCRTLTQREARGQRSVRRGSLSLFAHC